jgi:hypothetical protein
VTWQEELSQLDGALATGQISADDYRRERERILAVATGGIQQGPPQGGQGQGQGPGQGAPPVNRGSDAFPPPFKWTTERPNPASEDTTQAVPTTSQASPAESTQIVNANASDSTQIVDMKDSASMGPGPSFGDRTQVVSQVPLTSPPQGTPAPWQQQGQQGPPQGGWGPQQQQGTPWENQEELVPPWGGGYQAQEAEIFDAEPSSGKGKVWAIVGVVVLLLAITGGVLWLTVFNKQDGGGTAQQGGDGQQQEEPTKQQPAPPKEPDPYGPLYVPEGTTKGGKTYSAAELEESNVLPPPDVVLIKQAGLTEAKAVVVVQDGTTIDLWAFGTNDPAQLAEDMTNDQVDRFGFKKVAGEAVDGVEVYTSQQKSASRTVFVYRAHYTAGDDMIRVEAFDTDKNKAKTQFDAALEAQLELTPPE